MLEQTTTASDSKSVLTIVEIASLLRCSKAHVCNLMAGKVRGAPKLTHVCLGRRKLSTLHGSAIAWSRGRVSDTLGFMSGLFVAFAGKRKRSASKTFRAGMPHRPQREEPEILVCTME